MPVIGEGVGEPGQVGLEHALVDWVIESLKVESVAASMPTIKGRASEMRSGQQDIRDQ